MNKTWVIGIAAVALFSLTIGCAGIDSELSPEEIALREQGADDIASGKEDNGGCSGTVVPDRSGFNKRIALTFDDGPNLTTTPKVLETLKRHNVRATFFINGKSIANQAQKDLLQSMHSAGHFVGNHTQTHVNMAQVSAATAASEIEKTHNLLNGLSLGPKYFRFPYGSASCSTAEKVRSFGYHVTGWHIDSADWCYQAGHGYCSPSTFRYVDNDVRDDMVEYVARQAKSVGGGILLFHDIHSNTVANLDAVLTRLENDGFTFTTLDDEEVFPKLNGVTAPVGPWVGTPCTTDDQCGFTVNNVRGYCHEFTSAGTGYGFCTLPCEGYCPDKSGSAPTFCTSLDDNASGMCVSKAGDANNACRAIPGTVQTGAPRFIGDSSASASNANVCLPAR